LLSSSDVTPVRLLLEIAPASDRASLSAAFQRAGATVHSWSGEGRLITISIAPAGIAQLSALDDVSYIEAAETYRD
jgi:hypothetical protein